MSKKEKKPKKKPKGNSVSVIFTATHEVGNLSEYTTSSGADVSVATGAALAGTKYGMNVLCDDATLDYAYKTLSPVSSTGKSRARFYFDPNSISISAGGHIGIFVFWSTGGQAGGVRAIYDSGSYKIYAYIVNDSAAYFNSSNISITDEPHYIEVYLQRASSNVASDGVLNLWVDGSGLQVVNGIDNYDKFVDLKYINFGQRELAGTVSGTFYCDELKVNDDGGLIGGIGNPKNFMFYKRMRQSHVA